MAKAKQHGQLGIIESVSLRNFMCHDNLKFNFDPHMNFITGRNGSGKSAVLTGIILALGGKSGATGRYSNIKGFVKTGKHSACVSVTLKNCGPEAYKPKEFGERIIVERNFTSDGVSTYKLKSQSGQILSTSKEELTNILNTMDIQIENPITVLTQEISRNFLVSKNAKEKKLFELFYKGTGLAKIEEDYKRAVQHKEESTKEVELKKEALPDMEKEIKTLKGLLDSSAKLTELKSELLWAMVIESEKDRDEKKNAYDKIINEETTFQKKQRAIKRKIDELTQDLTKVQAERKECEDKRLQVKSTLMTEHAKREILAKEVREISGKLSRYDREAMNLSYNISSLEKMLNDIQLRNENDINEDKIRHEETIKELKTDIASTSDKAAELDAMRNVLVDNHHQIQAKIDHCQAEIQDLENKSQNIMRERDQLLHGRDNKLNVFGREMAAMFQEIEASAAMFKTKPKGPIGIYINVKVPEWSFVIQECLGTKFLYSFCCDNHSDADLLTKIFTKYYPSERTRPSIITSKFINKVHDVSRFKTVTKDYPTVLDMLDVEDPVITNFLIDQKKIENIILIADEKDAIDLMMNNPPKNCKCAYTRNGDQFYHSPYRNYACRSQNKICLLKNVNDDDITNKEHELFVINQELKKKNAIKNSLKQDLHKCSEQITFVENEFMKFRTKIKELQRKLKDEENNYEEPKDISCLNEDLQKLLREQSQLHSEIFPLKSNYETKNEELKDLDERITDLKNILQTEKDNFQKLSTLSDEIENKKENLDVTLKKVETILKKLESPKEEARKSLENAVALSERLKSNAEGCSARINTERSSEAIKGILSETKKVLNEQRKCDIETLTTQYKEKVEKLKKAKAELNKLTNINLHIAQMMEKRFEEFTKICKASVISLACTFTQLLSERNFSGSVKVDLKNQTIEINAQPSERAISNNNNDEPPKKRTRSDELLRKSNECNKKQNLAQLSGGERSFVTMAFILSLWERIHMPFRILDEYDVFMDANNRHLSINILINSAKANRHVQYILLSPLELPPMEEDIDAKIHKMPEPKR